jgi:hypothetical protein
MLKIKQTVETVKDGNQLSLSEEQIAGFNGLYDQIVSSGLLINPAPKRVDKKGVIKGRYAFLAV